jgi:hypothetical protein
MNGNRSNIIAGKPTQAPIRSEPGTCKDAAAQALGSKGGKKRAQSLTAEQRSAIARTAALARWSRKQDSSEEELPS